MHQGSVFLKDTIGIAYSGGTDTAENFLIFKEAGQIILLDTFRMNSPSGTSLSFCY